MNLTEAPAVAADDREQPDDMLTRGWAAPAADRREVDRLEALGVAQRNTILEQVRLIAELGHRLVEVEQDRDSALETAVREHAENDRLAADNRLLRERVARQRETIESLRRQLAADGTGRVLAAVDAALGDAGPGEGPCACLAPPQGVSPLAGRWLPWSRGQR